MTNKCVFEYPTTSTELEMRAHQVNTEITRKKIDRTVSMLVTLVTTFTFQFDPWNRVHMAFWNRLKEDHNISKCVSECVCRANLWLTPLLFRCINNVRRTLNDIWLNCYGRFSPFEMEWDFLVRRAKRNVVKNKLFTELLIVFVSNESLRIWF